MLQTCDADPALSGRITERGEATAASVCLENKDWTAGNHLGSQAVYVFLRAPGWSVASRLQVTSWHQARAVGKSALPRSLCSFGGISPSTRVLQWVSCETTGLLVCQHQGHWLWSQQRSCSVLEPKKGWAVSFRARGTASLTTWLLLLVFSNVSIKIENWIPNLFFEMGLNVYFCKHCQGLGLGWGW